jgi:predicted phosphodiesterase
MKIAVISDIHANLAALSSVIADIEGKLGGDWSAIQLGDLVDYGPRPNEVVDRIRALEADGRIRVNLAGNHEAALLGLSLDRFSTDRGRASLEVTKGLLREDTRAYLGAELSYEPVELEIAGKRVLCVHGTASDPWWGSLAGPETRAEAYLPYDLVLTGHTHLPVFTEEFFPVADSARRNRKKTVFLNPGSVGQPRNHDARAQYAVWDTATGEFSFSKVAYDIAAEQSHFAGNVDPFYRARLAVGV